VMAIVRIERYLFRPILDAQTRNAAELPHVIRDQSQIPSHGLGGDERVEWANGSAGALQLRSHSRVNNCVLRRELEDEQGAKKIFDQAESFAGRRALGGASPKFSLGHHTHRDIFAIRSEQALDNIPILLQRIDTDVRVE
jgi:hypothetical protein